MPRLAAVKRPGLVAVAVIFLSALAIGLIQGEKLFYYDSGSYWELAGSFDDHGSFSFLHFEYTGLRGYALPLTFYLLREIGDLFGIGPSGMVILLNSALFALIAGLLGPRLAEIAWPRHWGLLPRLALGALILVFWSGYLNFPLSDFPALFAAVLALVAVSHSGSPLWLGLGGASAAYAVNARPAYLLLIPLVVLVLAWSWWRERPQLPQGALRWVLCGVAFVAGLAVISVPQSIVEHHATGGLSPLPGGNGLAGLQYTEGLRLQRYETFVGGGPPRMDYLDPSTESILAELDAGTVSDTSQYAEIALSNPLTIAGVFLRHVVNGLDQRYTTPYVEHLEPSSRRLLRLTGFLLVFLALFRVLWPRGRRSLGGGGEGETRWRYPAALLICCATSLPSAIETRFLLPVFLLSGLVVLTPAWPNPLDQQTGLLRFRTLAITSLLLVIYIALVASIVSGATDHLVLS